MEDYKCIKADTIEEMKKKVDNLDSLREVITEISTLMKVQIELGRKTDIRMEKFENRLEEYDKNMNQHAQTFIYVTNTIEKQNKSLERLNEKLDSTKEDLNEKLDSTKADLNKKITDINTKVDIQNIDNIKRNSFDIWDFIKTKVIPAILIAGVIYLIIQVK